MYGIFVEAQTFFPSHHSFSVMNRSILSGIQEIGYEDDIEQSHTRTRTPLNPLIYRILLHTAVHDFGVLFS